ncbi:MAG: hypothetical protein FJY48_12370, partial [Betaproteobacteria bacterium]|nr:hypothetical protein [Betaproteobacteria bacterium]
KTGDLVGDADSEDPVVYRYIGDDDTVDLSEADFTKTDLWEKISERWNYQTDNPLAELATDEMVLVPSGQGSQLYRYLGDDDEIHLGRADYSDDTVWEAVDTFRLPEEVKVSLKSGDMVDASQWDFTTEDGEVDVLVGDLVASLDGFKVYRYLGVPVEVPGAPIGTEPVLDRLLATTIDLSAVDFDTDEAWEEVLAWRFVIADDALDFNPELVPDPAAITTTDPYDPDNDAEFVFVKEGDLVALADEGVVYRFLGERQAMDLLTADFTDTDQWVRELGRGYVYSGLTDLAVADFTDTDIWKRTYLHTVDPATKTTAAVKMKTGDLLDLSSAATEQVYRYLGDGGTVYLGQTDFDDADMWQTVQLRRELVKAEAEAEASAEEEGAASDATADGIASSATNGTNNTTEAPVAEPTNTRVQLRAGQLVLANTASGGKVVHEFLGLTDLGAADFRDTELWTAQALTMASPVEEVEFDLSSGEDLMIKITSGEHAGLYRYLEDRDTDGRRDNKITVNLATADFNDDSVWEWRYFFTPPESSVVDIAKDDYVIVEGDEGDEVYQYIGRAPADGLDLAEADFGDDKLWTQIDAHQAPEADAQEVAIGQMVGLMDEEGRSTSYRFLGKVDLDDADFADDSVWESLNAHHAGVLAADFEDLEDDQSVMGVEKVVRNGDIVRVPRTGSDDFYQYLGTDKAIDLLSADYTDTKVWSKLKLRDATGSVTLEEGNLVRVAGTGEEPDSLYRYRGVTNLARADFSDDTLWEEIESGKKLRKGDTVEVADDHSFGGEAGAVYEYIGKNNRRADLSQEDFTDEAQWERVLPTLEVSVIEEGKRWKVLDADGKTYTLSKSGDAMSVSRNSINAVSVAASAALGLSGGGNGIAVSGAGAVAVNSVSGSTDALLQNSTVTSAKDVSLSANSEANISATIASLSIAVGAGSGNGIGASIGISIARNLIGQEGFGKVGEAAIATVRALSVDSDISAAETLALTANARQTIDALVLSGSAAIGAGAGNGLAASGSGVHAENQIGTRVHAGTETRAIVGVRVADIEAGDVTVEATDTSRIKSFAGAASVAAALGGNVGAALSIGVTIARNTIDTRVLASLAGANLEASGDVTVKATSDASIDVVAIAASVAAALGNKVGAGVAGAGASALNVILGDTLASIDDSALSVVGAVDVNAIATNVIDASIVSAALGIGVGGKVGVGASIGVSIARNYVGFDPYGYAGVVTYTSGKDDPSKIVKGNVVRLGPRSGARANEVYEYIGKDDLIKKDVNKDGELDDLILSQDFADSKKWKALANPSANLIQATVTRSAIDAQDVSLLADNLQIIDSTVFSGSVAASGGGMAGISLSGAGASALNRIGSQTDAYIANSTGDGIQTTGDISILARDDARIESSVMAVSVAAAFAGKFSVAVAIGVSTAENVISNSVTALGDRVVLIAGGDILVDASDQSVIDSESTAVAVAISGSAFGVSVAGGGANSYNTINTRIKAAIDRSTAQPVTGSIAGWSEAIAGGNLTVTALSISESQADVVAAAASFGLIAAAAAGTVAENRLSPVVDAFISSTEVEVTGDVIIKADGRQIANADVASIAVSSGASVGTSSVTTTDESIIRARIGDDVRLQSDVLSIEALARDDILQNALAASGGLFAGIAGAMSELTIAGTTIAGLGNRNDLSVGTLDLRAKRTQDFDATANNLAIGLFAGSGASSTTVVTGTADVLVGTGTQVTAENIVISSINNAYKTEYSAESPTLRSTSAGARGVDVLSASTELGNASRKFGANVRIGEGSSMTVSNEDRGSFNIDTLADIKIIDKVRVDGVAGLKITYANATQNANVVSNIAVDGATLRNLSGDLAFSTKTNANMIAEANTLTLAAIGGAAASALSTLNADNAILLNNASLVGDDVKLYAGQDRERSSGIINGLAEANMTLFALYGASVPITQMTINESNRVRLDGTSSVRAVGDVDMMAEQGIGGSERAETDGLVINVSFIP